MRFVASPRINFFLNTRPSGCCLDLRGRSLAGGRLDCLSSVRLVAGGVSEERVGEVHPEQKCLFSN